MTTTYKEVVQQVTRREIESCTCDWCSKDLPEDIDTGYGGRSERDFELTYTTGYSFPDDWGGSGWCVEDMCDDCVDKLKTALANMGIKITELDY